MVTTKGVCCDSHFDNGCWKTLQIRELLAHDHPALPSCCKGFLKTFWQTTRSNSGSRAHSAVSTVPDSRKRRWRCRPSFRVVCALRFFYTHTLNRKVAIERIPFPRRERKLPLILSREEVQKLLEAPRNLRHRTLLAILYGCGLRVAEATQLKVSDIDSARHVLKVRCGKGRRDRQTLLPAKLLELLRFYWRRQRPTDWLFPGAHANRPISVKAAYAGLSESVWHKMPASLNRFIRTRCGMPSPRTCWKPA